MFAKPNLGMFKRCERENPHIKFKGGYFVGDRLCDMKAAFKVGATPVLVRSGHGLTTEKQITKTFKKFHQSQILIFNNLQDFADDICDYISFQLSVIFAITSFPEVLNRVDSNCLLVLITNISGPSG